MPETIDLILAKRDGRRLADDDIRWLIAAHARGDVPDEQMSALLMAIYFRGLEPAELRTWTAAMVASGERLDLGSVPWPTVDKHSTGGVGDKVSLILAPLVASCGAAVPQLSGRGLGHTGGTLDKLESIPGWRAALPPDEMISVLGGGRLCHLRGGPGPSPGRPQALRAARRHRDGRVDPADREFHHVQEDRRGHRGARPGREGRQRGVHRDPDGARRLAQTMVTLGAEHGVRTSALLTRMDAPLGRAVGNAVEVAESVDTLRGEGPADLVEVTLALATEMLRLAGVDADPAAALADGRALRKYRDMIAAQGGDPDAPLPQAVHDQTVTAPESGWLRRLDARAVGVAAWRLGAGRSRKEDPVDPAAGLYCLVKPGDPVERGQPILDLRGNDVGRFAGARQALEGAVEIGPEPPPAPSHILERIGP